MFIELILVLLIFWMAANFWMRFLPSLATQLPLPIYEFLYAFTGAGEGISQDPLATESRALNYFLPALLWSLTQFIRHTRLILFILSFIIIYQGTVLLIFS